MLTCISPCFRMKQKKRLLSRFFGWTFSTIWRYSVSPKYSWFNQSFWRNLAPMRCGNLCKSTTSSTLREPVSPSMKFITLSCASSKNYPDSAGLCKIRKKQQIWEATWWTWLSHIAVVRLCLLDFFYLYKNSHHFQFIPWLKTYHFVIK